jgi:hypothetical protein
MQDLRRRGTFGGVLGFDHRNTVNKGQRLRLRRFPVPNCGGGSLVWLIGGSRTLESGLRFR